MGETVLVRDMFGVKIVGWRAVSGWLRTIKARMTRVAHFLATGGG